MYDAGVLMRHVHERRARVEDAFRQRNPPWIALRFMPAPAESDAVAEGRKWRDLGGLEAVNRRSAESGKGQIIVFSGDRSART